MKLCYGANRVYGIWWYHISTFLTLSAKCTVSIMLLGGEAVSQSLPSNMVKNTNPVSPEIASLGVYAMAPPNFANGLPNISISLFELKEHGLSYPLNMQYNSSGFRPTEEASSIGLGWMMTQGIITRVVKGLPDDNPTVKKKFEDFNNIVPDEFLSVDLSARFGTACYGLTDKKYDLLANRVYNKVYDGKPDEYIFNFNGYSGKFLWIKDKAMFLPHDNDLKISKNGSDFIIDTPDGLRYTFNEMERAYSYVRGGESNQLSAIFYAADCGNGDGPITFDGHSGYVSAWVLTKIENKNTKAQIIFSYQVYYHEESTTPSDWNSLTIWGDKYVCCGVGCARPNQGYSYYNSWGGTESLSRKSSTLLKEIISDNHKVVISYKDRADFPSSKAIDNIKVFYAGDLLNPVKEITFVHEYFGIPSNINSWLKLKNIGIKGAGEDRDYEFDYEEENARIVSNKKNCKSIDHWGYYNRALNNSLFPKPPFIDQWDSSGAFSFNINSIPWANRDPNFQYAKYYTLNKIKYPTKGYTKYYYESAGGRGVRLRAAEDFDGDKVIKKYYEYVGADPINPMYDFTQFDVDDPSPCSLLTEAHTSCSQNELPKRYITISGYIKYVLDYVDYSNFYPLVTEFIGSMDGKGGRTEYTFIKDASSGRIFSTGSAIYSHGATVPTEEMRITYNQRLLSSINCFNDPTYINKSTYCVFDPVYNYALAEFLFFSSPLSSIWFQKVKEEYITNYGNAILKVVENHYKEPDTATGVPFTVNAMKTKLNTSDGKSKTSEYYYPGDIDPDNDANTLGVPEMWNPLNANYKYLISDPIKVRIVSEDVMTHESYSLYSYLNASDRILRTQFVETVAGEIMAHNWYFTYTENGLVKTIKKNQEQIESFLWGYSSFLPVAHAVNADDTEVFYEGFEYGNDGNLGYTGKHSSQGDYSLSFVPPNNRKYVYSYWYRENGTWNFSGLDTYLNPITLTNHERIDDVRVYPYDAKVTTYTHNPLIGLTSKTDERDIATFFNYDNVGRLSNLTDYEGNILESYNYSLTDISREPTLYFNSEVRQAFTKNDCPVIDGELLTADPIDYIVPASTFSSSLSYEDAMDMAIKNIEESGQLYANENCRCGITVRVFDQGVLSKIDVLKARNTVTQKIYTLPYGKKEMLLPIGNYSIEIMISDGGLDAFGHIEMAGNNVPRVCYNNWGGNQIFFNADLSTSNGLSLLFTLGNNSCQ